ncbi:unnamed protein product [Adineta steineri]|uniref:Uncharacterized protein n=2 Tax=Adineta steineri TaxID=433720 RepID=A0A815RUZ4_9BILA|nr:unnamed protein product [Adineta steineri]
MSSTIHVEFLLCIMDEACEEWKQKFQKFTVELLQNIQLVFNVGAEYMTEFSKSTTNDKQTIEDHENVERIISKLKHIKTSLGNLWPKTITCFVRDAFDVSSYHINVVEYFHSTPFYQNNPYLMKLYQWSVYDVNRKLVCCYFLETTQLPNCPEYYVLGKTRLNTHSQIYLYGSTIPDYYQMRTDVIKDVNGQGPQPVVTSTRNRHNMEMNFN